MLCLTLSQLPPFSLIRDFGKQNTLVLKSDVCGNYVLSVLSTSPPNNLVVSFLTGIQYILASALIWRCRDSNLYDRQSFLFFGSLPRAW